MMNRAWAMQPSEKAKGVASADSNAFAVPASGSSLPAFHLRLDNLRLSREPEAMAAQLGEALRLEMGHPMTPEMQRLVAQAAQNITASLQQAVSNGARP